MAKIINILLIISVICCLPTAIMAQDAQPAVEEAEQTVSPGDNIIIAVKDHPELSGTFPVDESGKLEYKLVGGTPISGLDQEGLQETIRGILSQFVAYPEFNLTIIKPSNQNKIEYYEEGNNEKDI